MTQMPHIRNGSPMAHSDDRRLIEDYLPIVAISAEASRFVHGAHSDDNPDTMPLMIQNPAKYLEHAAKAVVPTRYNDMPAEAVIKAVSDQGGTR